MIHKPIAILLAPAALASEIVLPFYSAIDLDEMDWLDLIRDPFFQKYAYYLVLSNWPLFLSVALALCVLRR